MDGETIISWTPANWLTVLLMVAIGFSTLAFVSKLIQQKKTGTSS